MFAAGRRSASGPFNSSMKTPLHYCAKIGNVDVLRMIVTAMTPKELVRAINMQNKVSLVI